MVGGLCACAKYYAVSTNFAACLVARGARFFFLVWFLGGHHDTDKLILQKGKLADSQRRLQRSIPQRSINWAAAAREKRRYGRGGGCAAGQLRGTAIPANILRHLEDYSEHTE